MSDHPGGRLILLWDEYVVKVDVLFSSAQLIHCQVSFNDGFYLEMFVVYGFNDDDGKIQL